MAQRTTTSTSTASGRHRVFVDTGGWYAVTSERDRHHEAGRLYYLNLLDEGAHLLTSDYVLDETLTRLRYDFGHAVALRFWQQTTRAQEKGSLTILWVDERVWKAAMGIFQKYADQDFSFTDCTSFALAREHRVDEVFAFDRHFLMFGLAIKPTL
ncbi:MAG: type II toxin-antitoxin system VapC family toxin [Planctomycetes bacterium]|nr:type II toxin-antitoxin system VapC family toxin [Planctomycetota bacterium]MBM4087287.1 type II toxin-antitoxin system VapC family toxin [Planctomycetota bacterium]